MYLIEVYVDDELLINESTPNYKEEIIDLANKEFAVGEQAMFDRYAMSSKPRTNVFKGRYEEALEYLKREDLHWIKVKESDVTYENMAHLVFYSQTL